jgi:biofilm PGA synthesis N-glycosyltransferase PgaC
MRERSVERYALVTPARDEAANLARVANAVASQTILPRAWVIVENGSRDETLDLARSLEEQLDWVTVVVSTEDRSGLRGGQEALAFTDGLAALDEPIDVIVKLDADVSFEQEFFERLLDRFASDPELGIASGVCLEQDEAGEWQPIYTSRAHARGATRAYRSACLEDVLPLEADSAWDTVDELKAKAAGWTTATFRDIPFYHHRKLGTRDGSRRAWIDQGRMAYYTGYRPSYVVGRAVFRSLREPMALASLAGYAGALIRRDAQCSDPGARRILRDEQRLRHLVTRLKESGGRAGGDAVGVWVQDNRPEPEQQEEHIRHLDEREGVEGEHADTEGR